MSATFFHIFEFLLPKLAAVPCISAMVFSDYQEKRRFKIKLVFFFFFFMTKSLSSGGHQNTVKIGYNGAIQLYQWCYNDYYNYKIC